MNAAVSAATPSRDTVEEFIYREQELLDNWQLTEWAELYTEDAQYDIASLDAARPLEADPATSLFVVSDNKARITSRARRLLKKTAHAEFPHSKTRHVTSNVRVGVMVGD
jgi:p-cumate 2,3-dioxygenase beta subunit